MAKAIGQQLAALRRSRGTSQVALADKMGLAARSGARYIQLIEAGKVSPTLAWLHRFYAALGLHLYLLSLDEDGHCPRAPEAQEALELLHQMRRKQANN